MSLLKQQWVIVASQIQLDRVERFFPSCRIEYSVDFYEPLNRITSNRRLGQFLTQSSMAQYAQYGAPMHGSMPMQGDAAPNSSGMLGPPGRGDPSTTVFGKPSHRNVCSCITLLLLNLYTIEQLLLRSFCSR